MCTVVPVLAVPPTLTAAGCVLGVSGIAAARSGACRIVAAVHTGCRLSRCWSGSWAVYQRMDANGRWIVGLKQAVGQLQFSQANQLLSLFALRGCLSRCPLLLICFIGEQPTASGTLRADRWVSMASRWECCCHQLLYVYL